MSRQTVYARGIVLARTNYGEADRIATVLTDTAGKVRVMVKGARKSTSKLASGVELFCVSAIGFIPGRGELSTLVSARLDTHHVHFLHDLDRVEFAYACLRQVHKVTEEVAGPDYFLLLQYMLAALDDLQLPLIHIRNWWTLRLLHANGHTVNTVKTCQGNDFNEQCLYEFDYDNGGFRVDVNGPLSPLHVKYVRLAQTYAPSVLHKIHGGDVLAADLQPVIQTFALRVA